MDLVDQEAWDQEVWHETATRCVGGRRGGGGFRTGVSSVVRTALLKQGSRLSQDSSPLSRPSADGRHGRSNGGAFLGGPDMRLIAPLLALLAAGGPAPAQSWTEYSYPNDA